MTRARATNCRPTSRSLWTTPEDATDLVQCPLSQVPHAEPRTWLVLEPRPLSEEGGCGFLHSGAFMLNQWDGLGDDDTTSRRRVRSLPSPAIAGGILLGFLLCAAGVGGGLWIARLFSQTYPAQQARAPTAPPKPKADRQDPRPPIPKPQPPAKAEPPKEDKAKDTQAAIDNLKRLLEQGKEFAGKRQFENARSCWEKVTVQASPGIKEEQIARVDALFWLEQLANFTNHNTPLSGLSPKEEFEEGRKRNSAADGRLIRILFAWQEAGLSSEEANQRRFKLFDEWFGLTHRR